LPQDRLSPARHRSLALSVYHPPPPEHPWPLEALFSGIYHELYPFARHALLEALRLCGVRAGDRVLIPEFICREVLAPIHCLGAKPLYYSVRDSLEAIIDPDRLPGATAALAVNYFGFPQPLGPFRRYCRRTGACLIEDNAHGLFSRDTDGTLLGTRGDMGVFSLRKTLFLPNGGMLTVMRPDLIKGRATSDDFSYSRWDRVFWLKQLARRLIGGTGLTGAHLLISLNRLLRKIVTGHYLPPPNPDGEHTMPVPDKVSPLLRRNITTGDPHHETIRRRKLYHFFLQNGAAMGIRQPLFPQLPEGAVPQGFPFVCPTHEFKTVAAKLRNNGYLSMSWPDLPAAISGNGRDFYHMVRLVPFLW